jgi:hypothetical protein
MDVTVARGNSLLLEITVANPDGTVRDITGALLTFKVYDSPSRETHVMDGTAAVDSGVDGTVSAYLTSADTAAFDEYHVFYYCITLTESDSTVTDVLDGKLFIK